MARYLLKRLAIAASVIFLVMTALALLVHLVPGDPVVKVLGNRATPELIAAARLEMKLDDPVYVQVWSFVSGAVHGDLGNDFVSQIPVTDLIVAALPHTLVLAVSSLLLASLVGIPLGVLSAVHPNGWVDRGIGAISISFITLPPFVASLLLLIVFAVELDVLPAVGAGSFSEPGDYALRLILPSVALALGWIGYLARLVRTSMLEVMGSAYIRTAHAFGVSEGVVFYRLGLKNAVIPTVAVLGIGLGALMGGAFFAEVIFARPGLGRLAVDAIDARNYPVVRAVVLVTALLFILANLVTDICYRFLDPRIRVEESIEV